jgi:hypothetical protein
VIKKAIGIKVRSLSMVHISLVFQATAYSADRQPGAPIASRDESDLTLFRKDSVNLRAHADQIKKLLH